MAIKDDEETWELIHLRTGVAALKAWLERHDPDGTDDEARAYQAVRAAMRRFGL